MLRRKNFWIAIFVLAVLAGAVIACNVWIVRATAARMFTDVLKIPANQYGLVLGTGKQTEMGRANQHFTQRINAAAALFKAGKVQRLILSGDEAHDEPLEMKRALIAKGVPATALQLDNAGLRTLDSVVRAKEVFKQTKLTIISERFHNARALFLCRHFAIDAVAFAPPDVPRSWLWRATTREYLARVRAVLDVYVFKTLPSPLVK